jgi:DNA-binding beta-propeller fold protein YncE
VAILSARDGRLLGTAALSTARGIDWQGNDAIAVDAPSQRVFVLNGGDTVSMLDAGSGALVRTISVGQQPYALGMDPRRGRVFVVTASSPGRLDTCAYGYVSMLDGRSGRILRTTRLWIPRHAQWPRRSACSDSVLDGPGAMAADAVAGRLYVVNRLAHGGMAPASVVNVLDTGTGALLATVPLPAPPLAVAVDSVLHRAYVAGLNMLTAIDVGGKILVSRYVAGGSDAVLVDPRTGRVFVSSHDGNSIAVFDAASCKLLLSTAVAPGTGSMVLDARSGRIYVAHLDGTYTAQQVGADTGQPSPYAGRVTVLDPATGRVVDQVKLDGYPETLAVDDRIGRVFVATHRLESDRAAQNDHGDPWKRWLGWLPWLKAAPAPGPANGVVLLEP